MDSAKIKFTIYFENPFWIGFFEKSENGKLSVCKVVFGAEPKDNEVLKFILKNYYSLKYSIGVSEKQNNKTKINPKRIQKEVKKQIENIGVSKKSWQALKLQQEQNKILKKTKNKEQKELEKEKMYNMKQQKKIEKHKGR